MPSATLARKHKAATANQVSPANGTGETAEGLRIPLTASTLNGFVAWATSADFPRRGRISFFDQELFIDMSPEELETHNKVKTAVTSTIFRLSVEFDEGEVFSDGALLTNADANLSTEADGLFVKWESYENGHVELVPRAGMLGQYIEVRGIPDWAMEVISRTSVQKDTVILPALYHKARIPEFWLINAMREQIDFKIFVWRQKGYVAVRPRGGWLASPVFGRSFRLVRHRNRMDRWQYELLVRPS